MGEGGGGRGRGTLQARPSVGTGRPGRTGRPSRRARNGAEARPCRAMPQHRAVERSRIALERTHIAPDKDVAFDFELVSLGLHCFLWFSAAGLIAVLFPGCCWAYSAFSV